MFGFLKLFKKKKAALVSNPFWLCQVCAYKRGGWMGEGINWIIGKCDDCRKMRAIADPKDFNLYRKPRIQWICMPCANNKKWHMPAHHLASWHTGECGVCKTIQIVTEPRDFGIREKHAN